MGIGNLIWRIPFGLSRMRGNVVGTLLGNGTYGSFLKNLDSFQMREVIDNETSVKMFRELIRVTRHVESNLNGKRLAKIQNRYKNNPEKLESELARFIQVVESDMQTYTEHSETLLNSFDESMRLCTYLQQNMFEEVNSWLQKLQTLSQNGEFVVPENSLKQIIKDWGSLLQKAERSLKNEIADYKKLDVSLNNSKKVVKPSFFWTLTTGWITMKGKRILDNMFIKRKFNLLMDTYSDLKKQIDANEPKADFFPKFHYLISNYKILELSKHKLKKDIAQQIYRFEELTTGLFTTLAQFCAYFQHDDIGKELKRSKDSLTKIRDALIQSLQQNAQNDSQVKDKINAFRNAYAQHTSNIQKNSKIILDNIQKNSSLYGRQSNP
ncbi:MAG: hypothetical protein ACMXYF_01370 [Candidatus Woesearchaeota archaeon]